MKTVNSVKIAQSLFLLNAAIWLAFGIASLARMGSRPSAPVITLWIIAVLMFGNVGAMLLSGAGLGKRQKRWYYFALAVLIVNIILTVTDEFGFFDLVTLVIDLVLLGFLIATRQRYSSLTA